MKLNGFFLFLSTEILEKMFSLGMILKLPGLLLLMMKRRILRYPYGVTLIFLSE